MNAKDDHSYALSVIATREREIHELRYAIMNIRYVLHMAGAELPLNETSTLGLSTALAIVDAATLHLIPHDDMLVEPYPELDAREKCGSLPFDR
ncbi:hypothetical protein [Symbiopectobacterium purcellii]|uniref:Uncharacterized protein n=1 Tax=Symbiopectobacterium purcellii TaxID=2871826 RepID=A0ABX9ARN1_9ENTR|nr:hypothetical protein [Symbiopectobacterium purcellii]QZN96435.1 hypothetical protein K6K13_02930 [Symbiopectobacterium purcellii]